MSDALLCSIDAGVATVTLSRPQALNALDADLKQSLIDTLGALSADTDVRAVVLTGAGRAFCVGQNLREHAAGIEHADPTVTPLSTVRKHYNPILRLLTGMPKPSVAAVNGVAAGAGAALAFACDLRVMAEAASFNTAFAGVGLGTDSGASWTLPRLVGHARATALLLLGEPVDAHQALAMGLVNAVVPSESVTAVAAELAGRLALGPTLAYAAIKEALARSSASTLEEALEREADLQERLGASQDHRDAVRSFLAKQPPVFHGR